MPRTPRLKFSNQEKAQENADAHYGEDSLASQLVSKFGPILSPRVQDHVFKQHGSSLDQARLEGFRGTEYGMRHAHVHDVLDHLGY